MIAIVADDYADALEYMELVAAQVDSWSADTHRGAPPSTEWIVVLRPEDIRLGLVLTGAVFLGSGVAAREAVAGTLASVDLGQPKNTQAIKH